MSSFQIADRIVRIRESVPQNQPLVKNADAALREPAQARTEVHSFDNFTNFGDFDNFGNA